MPAPLNEAFVIYPDNTYRRQTRYVMIAQVNSLVPKGYAFDPDISGGGSSKMTWGRVQSFFSHYPESRRHQQPMHWYTEFLLKDYVTFVGLPYTNTSWWLQEMVRLGALDPVHTDSLLIVLQENYSVESMEKRLWQVLAHSLISPLLRELQLGRDRVVFFEKVANREVVDSKDYPYQFSEATYLDEVQLELFLKHYGKR